MEGYVEVKNTALEKVRQWMYYFVIGIISFIALVFLPMIGSTIGLGWNVPNTTVGWVVWVAVKLIIATINILIFHSFMCQAKLNIKEDKNYLEACTILQTIKEKEYVPRSPKKWQAQTYGRKGTIIFLTSALAVIALTQAMLTFDWMAMLTYLFTIIMGIIFGVLQMKVAEEYWTTEFWKYAKMVEAKSDEEREKEEREKEEREKAIQAENERVLEVVEKECIKQGNSNIPTDSRVDILESSNSNSTVGDNSESVVLDGSECNNIVLGSTRGNTCNTYTDSIDICSKSTMEESNKEKEECRGETE